MRLARMYAFILLAVYPLLISCGGGKGSSPITPPVLNPAALNGNWLIIKTENGSGSPFLAISLGFIGNQGSAYGSVGVTCSNGSTISGFLNPFTGTASSDGSFQLSSVAGDIPGIVLKGQVPATASAGLKGTYSFTGGTIGPDDCSLSETGSFVATAYPAITGTYAGTLSTASGGASFQISLQLSQGSYGPTPQIPQYLYYLTDSFPVTAVATITGSSCYTSGTTNDMTPGVMTGDGFVTHLAMSDGSVSTVNGYFTDSSEQSLSLQFSNTSGLGKCLLQTSGTLTRQ